VNAPFTLLGHLAALEGAAPHRSTAPAHADGEGVIWRLPRRRGPIAPTGPPAGMRRTDAARDRDPRGSGAASVGGSERLSAAPHDDGRGPSEASENAAGQPHRGEITLDGVTKTYLLGPVEVQAIGDLSTHIAAGEFVVLLGPSGSGKTTLLNLIGAIEPPDAGRIEVSGTHVSALAGTALTEYRRTVVGFVFQFFNLVPTLTASENVEVVAELIGPNATERASAALDRVGLADRLHHFPAQLSGGEQQRVAVARALVKDAPVVLADEPTGSLDLDTGKQILGLLRGVADAGRTILLVTHNSAIASIADRVLELRDGQLVDDRHIESPLPVSEVRW